MNASERIATIQTALGVTPDGIFGPRSRAALADLIQEASLPQGGVTRGMATSFADPADVAAFKRCKTQGHSDMFCFGKGDNGIGVWGDDTTIDHPYCALPRDDWQHLGGAARGARVKVTIAGKTVICELRDTLPWKRNIVGDEVIDLNPGALKRFGLRPPTMVPVEWSWA